MSSHFFCAIGIAIILLCSVLLGGIPYCPAVAEENARLQDCPTFSAIPHTDMILTQFLYAPATNRQTRKWQVNGR
jgi:hypothetical protein